MENLLCRVLSREGFVTHFCHRFWSRVRIPHKEFGYIEVFFYAKLLSSECGERVYCLEICGTEVLPHKGFVTKFFHVGFLA